MRKILAFGMGRTFMEHYAGFFSRNGFQLEAYSGRSRAAIDPARPPVLIVSNLGLGRREEEGLSLVLGSLRQPQIIFISSPGAGLSAAAKKARTKAVRVLTDGFLKKELLAALKSADEILSLREKTALLQSELSQKTRELSCLMDVAKHLSSSLDFSRAINKIMERTRTMIGAESWAVFLVDAENNCLVFNSAKGSAGGGDARFRLAPGEGIAGWAMQDMEPKLINDVSADPHFSKAVDRATGVRSKSVMAVPISVKGKLLGVAELINKGQQEGFTPDDLKTVMTLMSHTALAVERSQLYQRMEDLAITDDLTKLFNLRYLDRTLEVEIERANRYNLSVSLIFMDIDFFKNVNDRHGHLVGSKLLVEISQILLLGLRKVDIVARYGGDEFVIVLPQTGVEAARAIAERMRKAIEKHTFLRSEGLALTLTASFGIASYPDHASSREELLKLADEAMYRVKYQTRNDVYVVGG